MGANRPPFKGGSRTVWVVPSLKLLPQKPLPLPGCPGHAGLVQGLQHGAGSRLGLHVLCVAHRRHTVTQVERENAVLQVTSKAVSGTKLLRLWPLWPVWRYVARV
jgi:hypothetical protein